MAFARDSYTATEEQTDFTITFPYITASHVQVFQEGVLLTTETDYDIISSTTVRLVTEATAGDTVILQRSTSQSTRLVDYASASSLVEEDLDNDSLQAFYMCQEAIDSASLALGVDSADLWDAEGVRITEVGTPTASTDAATKGYVDTVLTDEGNLPASTEVEDGNVLVVTTEGAVSWAELAEAYIPDGLIDAGMLAALTITEAELAAESVTNAKIEDGSVNTEHFTAEAVDAAALEAATITAAKMAFSESTEGKVLTNEEGTSVAWATNPGKWTYGAEVTLSGTDIDILEGIVGTNLTEIEIFFNDVSSDTASEPAVVRMGGSGGLELDGYNTLGSGFTVGGAAGVALSTEGFMIASPAGWGAAETYTGTMRITRASPTAHKWFATSFVLRDDLARGDYNTGHVTLASELTDIGMSLEGGVDTFDGGTARARYR